MAMPSGNAVVTDGKSKFQASAGAGEIRHGHQPPLWFPDERDGFISWLRGEFAAANAIIDGLCHHLRAVGEPGEYDNLITVIQQRRSNWTSVLHMQQYFPVSEIVHALNQVSWKKQQQQQHHQHQHQQHQQHFRYYDTSKFGGKEFRRSSSGFNRNQGQRGNESVKEVHNLGAEGCTNNVSEVADKAGDLKVAVNPHDAAEDEKGAAPAQNLADMSLKTSGATEHIVCANSKSEAGLIDNGCMSTSKKGEEENRNQNGKQGSPAVPKTFVRNEVFDGKMVNVVDGMKLYEDLLDDAEVKRLVSLVNDMRAAGKRGQFQGQTYSISKRPFKGHGREIIQLGLPIVDAPLEDDKDRRIEAIPALLQEVIKRIIGMNITTMKPDSCIIDFFNEGDHSLPYSWPYWFGRPICLLSLTECDLTFGRVIAVDSPGNFRGSLKLSLSPGSLLALQGKSADFAKYALPSLCKLRILITFTKSQPKRAVPIDGQHHIPLPAIIQTSHRGPIPNKPFNHIRHPSGSKYFGSVPPKNVLPAPPIIAPINGLQPMLVPAPTMPFPAPVPIPAASTTGWAAAAPRHPPPHPNVPGTGVFLPPPGSGNASSPDQPLPSASAEQSPNVERGSEKDNGPETSNQGNHQCNGNEDGGKVMAKERT